MGVTAVAATTVVNSAEALPIVSSMDDHMKLNEDLKQDVPLAESTNATIEMLQEPEIAAEAGMEADTMVDELGEMLEKYEIPIGLTNKLMLISEYASLEFIIDDSGSMRLDTDTIDPITRQPMSRWVEAQKRMKEMLEIIAYVPFQQIGIEFLNRKDRITLQRNGQSPQQFIQTSYCSESDDFHDEAREVLKDQGAALPYSKGFHLICQIVAVARPRWKNYRNLSYVGKV